MSDKPFPLFLVPELDLSPPERPNVKTDTKIQSRAYVGPARTHPEMRPHTILSSTAKTLTPGDRGAWMSLPEVLGQAGRGSGQNRA